MYKVDFLKELENLLQDISREERESALQYYEDYFEDAGPDREEQVIAELGSPERVAAIIKEELSGNRNEANDGEYTENGYIDQHKRKEKLELLTKSQQGYSRQQNNNANHDSNQNNTQRNGQGNTQYNSQYNTNYNSEWEHRNGNRNTRKESNIFLIILLCLFGIPIGLPLLITAMALAFSVLVTIFCFFISFILVAFALAVTGIILICAGFTQLPVSPAVTAALIGTGLILVGLGFLFGIFSIWLCMNVIPSFTKWLGEMWRKIFRRNKEAAV